MSRNTENTTNACVVGEKYGVEAGLFSFTVYASQSRTPPAGQRILPKGFDEFNRLSGRCLDGRDRMVMIRRRAREAITGRRRDTDLSLADAKQTARQSITIR